MKKLLALSLALLLFATNMIGCGEVITNDKVDPHTKVETQTTPESEMQKEEEPAPPLQEEITWSFDEKAGVLTISGSGAMEDYTRDHHSPWVYYKNLSVVKIEDGVTKIGNYAFSDCEDIISVDIPNSVTSIGDHAFYGCDALTTIKLSNNLTSIGSAAFCYCENLGQFELPDSLTSIGNEAFRSCQSLSHVNLPNGLTSISDDLFNYCTNLKSVTIPESITKIGTSAFAYCYSLSNLALPNSIVEIGQSAFADCRSIPAITIPMGVQIIGDYAFDDCSGLSSIIISASVESIGKTAFSSNPRLEYIAVDPTNEHYLSVDNCLIEAESKCLIVGCKNSIIPADGSVTSIGQGAFSGCTDLTFINIPAPITIIDQAAFYGCSNLSTVIFPESLIEIGEYAFTTCSKLTSLIIPRNTTKIEENAFSGCRNLEQIEVASENPAYHSKNNCLIERESKTLIIGCHNSSIPSDGSVTNIAELAFSKISDFEVEILMQGLEPSSPSSPVDLIIPEGVISIGDHAFSYRDDIASITLPSSLTSIGYFAFSGCRNLESIVISPENKVYQSKENCLIETESKTLFLACQNSTIPSDGSITRIDDSAFALCTNLKSITIPACIEKIQDGAFAYCTSLESIVVDPKNKTYHSYENCLIDTDHKFLISGCKNSIIPSNGSVTEIGVYAFGGCKELISITIPNCITTIEDAAFFGCLNLENIVVEPDNPKYYSQNNCLIEKWSKNVILGCKNSIIPSDDSVEGIGYGAFLASPLTSITLPKNIKLIDEIAFLGCNNLTSIVLPDGLTHISEAAFYMCSNLNSITVPNSVRSIETGAFYNTLAEIHYSGNMDQARILFRNAFITSNLATIIHCADGDLPAAEL